MGAFLDKPKTEKHTESGVGASLKYALTSMQGWRVEMEDAHTAAVDIPKLKDWAFFGVYDGHAGAKVSAACADKLLGVILDHIKVDKSAGLPTVQTVELGLREGFLRMDDQLRQLPDTLSGEDKSGSTAVCTLVSPTHIFFANCGDSRAVLSRSQRVSHTTNDHKPMNPGERNRIEKAGGNVMIQRVNGTLAVSRALGDFEYKNSISRNQCEQLVSPEPEVFSVPREAGDEFLVLACDGIWDVLSNDEVCDLVRHRMQVTDDIESICNCIVDTCLSKGSRDNMSVIIVVFAGAPTVSDAAKKREAELDAIIEKKIKDIIKSIPAESAVQYVMHLLSTENIPHLPPGGGIHAKQSLVESILQRVHPTPNNHQ